MVKNVFPTMTRPGLTDQPNPAAGRLQTDRQAVEIMLRTARFRPSTAHKTEGQHGKNLRKEALTDTPKIKEDKELRVLNASILRSDVFRESLM
jgi:hypothetical protein